MSEVRRYRPEIDGLRAVAVLPVVLFHAGLGCSGGYVGVDIFFVISGYLITGIILRDLKDETWSVKRFYHRRVKRILPVSTLVLLTTLVASYWAFLPGDYAKVAESAGMQALFLSNFYFWDQTGYFDLGAHDQPLLHFWSLAVEEQFYFIFPLLLAWAWRRGRERTATRLVWGMGLASLALSAVTAYTHVNFTYYLLPARMWELMLGGLLAVLPGMPATLGLRRLGGWCGLALMLGSALLYDDSTVFPGLSALAPTVGAVLLIWSQSWALTGAGRLLAWGPIRFIGQISYSLYLWHWPCLVLGRRIWGEDRMVAYGALAATVVLSVASYYAVEQPWRQKERLASFQKAGVFALACIAFSLGLSGAVVLSGGVPYPAYRAAAAVDYEVNLTLDEIAADRVRRVGDLQGEGPAFILWGDSHGMRMGPPMDLVARELGVWGYMAVRSATPPITGTWLHRKGELEEEPRAVQDATLQMIVDRHIPVVILVGRWSAYYGGPSEGGEARIYVTATKDAGPDTAAQALRDAIAATIAQLQAAGCRVIAMPQVPEWRTPPTVRGETGVALAEHLAFRDRVYMPALAGADAILDPVPAFFVDGHAIRRADGRLLYKDEDHLSEDGALRLAPELKRLLTAALAAPGIVTTDTAVPATP